MSSISGVGQIAPVSRLRITRRGRVVLALLVASLGLTVGLLGFGGGAIATSNPGSDNFQYLTVQPGQSLWDLAKSIAPNSDPRDVIADISRLNGLQGSTIHPGEQLAVPPAYAK